MNYFSREILILSQSQAFWTDVFFNVFVLCSCLLLSTVSTNSYSDWSIRHISWSEVAAVALPTFQTPPQVLVTRVEHEHAERVAREEGSFLGREVFFGGLAETWRLTFTCLKGLKYVLMSGVVFPWECIYIYISTGIHLISGFFDLVMWWFCQMFTLSPFYW